MAKKRGYKKHVPGGSNTVDTRRIQEYHMKGIARYGMAKSYVDSNIDHCISGPIHITGARSVLMLGIVGITAFVAPGMDGGLVSTPGADDYATGHPVIKSMTCIDHDTDSSIIDYRKLDVSGNYHLTALFMRTFNNLWRIK